HPIDLLANQGRVAEFSMSRGAGGFGWHTARDVVFRFEDDVALELALPFLVPSAAAKEAGPAHVYGYSSAGRSTRLMARASFSQRLVSSFRCLRPRAVTRR